MADIRVLGTSKGKAQTTFNTGAELTVNGATGRLEAAGSGDYVVAIALQAALEANHLVWVQVVPAYQKN
jgi:hypothetical protein